MSKYRKKYMNCPHCDKRIKSAGSNNHIKWCPDNPALKKHSAPPEAKHLHVHEHDHDETVPHSHDYKERFQFIKEGLNSLSIELKSRSIKLLEELNEIEELEKLVEQGYESLNNNNNAAQEPEPEPEPEPAVKQQERDPYHMD